MAKRALALDLGSSSVRAIVFEAGASGGVDALDGSLARRARQVRSQAPGQATFEIDDYLRDLVGCIDDLARRGCLDGVTEVAISSQWHSVVALDSGGAPVSELVSWADTRPKWSEAWGHNPADGPSPEQLEDMRQRTGCAFASMYWTWRAPWLERQCSVAPALYLGLAEYVGLKLLDDPAMSVSMASATGLLGTAEHAWDGEAVALAGIRPGSLPELAAAGWRGRLAPLWRRRWPQLAAAAWHPAVGDGAAANLGVGCEGPGTAALTVGTSAAVRAVRAAPDRSNLPAGLWRYCVDHDRVVLGAAYSSGGQLYSWALSVWEGVSAGPIEQRGGAAAAGNVAREVDYDVAEPAAAGSNGALVLPWHAGTRPPAPGVPAGQGCVVGLGLGHTGADLVSAAVEAVCFQLADGLADLEAGATGERGNLELVCNGGAIDRSDWWKRRLACVLGRPLKCPTVLETTARGVAALALGVAFGAPPPPSGPSGAGERVGAGSGAPPREGDGVQVVEPVADDVRALADARRQWKWWYETLRPIAARAGAPGGQA